MNRQCDTILETTEPMESMMLENPMLEAMDSLRTTVNYTPIAITTDTQSQWVKRFNVTPNAVRPQLDLPTPNSSCNEIEDIIRKTTTPMESMGETGKEIPLEIVKSTEKELEENFIKMSQKSHDILTSVTTKIENRIKHENLSRIIVETNLPSLPNSSQSDLGISRNDKQKQNLH